ncbi:MAG: T9SS type A sorting domain-containing protein, partial [Dysgonamonadaceae bacterium]|nr:T9SS type A sorting domain-containing protein [Dysgonamonadaceae bacterium]
FTAAEVPENMRARSGSVNLVDIDNDGNQDYANTGWRDGWATAFAINKLANGSLPSNTPPSAPENFLVSYNNGKYNLSWNAAGDTETATDALRYNLFIVDEKNDRIFAYAPVDTLSGKLKTGGGNITLINQTSFEVKLSEGKYRFGIQSIDQADAGSGFETYTYEPIIDQIKNISLSDVKLNSKDRRIEIRNTASSEISYSITTVNGQTVEKGIAGTGSTCSLQRLIPGIYLVKLTGNNNSFYQKVIVF